MELFEILCGIAVIIIALYYYFTSTFDFWKSRGVPGPRPIALFGNTKDVILNKKAMGFYLKDLYNEYKDEPMVGIFHRRLPILIVKDADLIKDVLIKDFPKFADRGLHVHERTDPLSQNLLNLESKRWKPLRTSLSPVFTSGKLKEMFFLITQCGDHLEQYLEKLVSKNEPIECRELMAKYTTDVIGTCAFGIEMNAMSNEDSEFRKMARQVFIQSFENQMRFRLAQYMPRLYNLLGYILPQRKVTKFFTRVITETLDYREKNNVIRHDFVDTLRELKKHPEKLGDIKLTDTLIAAQAFIFFIAGFETSSTVTSQALYELALNQRVQDKLREEINEEYAKHDSSLIYENIKKMSYLDKVFKEILRKYPPALYLLRKTTSSYTFDSPKVTIPKDQRVWIPVFGIHRDPDIYPEPEVFDPERFSEEVAQSRNPIFYLPFGDGPRNCIGARFAAHQSKIGIIKIIRNYKVEPCEKTQIPFIESPKPPILLAPKDGIYLKITKIKI